MAKEKGKCHPLLMAVLFSYLVYLLVAIGDQWSLSRGLVIMKAGRIRLKSEVNICLHLQTILKTKQQVLLWQMICSRSCCHALPEREMSKASEGTHQERQAGKSSKTTPVNVDKESPVIQISQG